MAVMKKGQKHAGITDRVDVCILISVIVWQEFIMRVNNKRR